MFLIKNKPIEIFLEHKVTRIEDGFVEVSDKDGRALTIEFERWLVFEGKYSKSLDNMVWLNI